MLATRADLKLRLGIEAGDVTQDGLLDDMLGESQALIEFYCARTIEYVAADIIETPRIEGELLLLQAWPVTALTSVKVDSTYAFTLAALAADVDYRLDGPSGRIWRLPRGVSWEDYGPQTIQVVYRGGYWDPGAGAAPGGVAVVPTNIQSACLMQAVEQYHRRRDPGYKSTGGMPAGVQFGFAPAVELLPAVMALLAGEARIT